MILACLEPHLQARVSFLPVRDFYDDERWDQAVVAGVSARTSRSDRIALVGHKKDHTSYYLGRFPGWSFEHVEPTLDIDATAIRSMLLGAKDLDAAFLVMQRLLRPQVLAYLRAWVNLPQFGRLRQEYAAVQDCRRRYTAPWYIAADALVRVGDHVLLVQRGGAVGRGLWAIPGGFVDEGEMFLPAALRELREETAFPFSAAQMRSALAGQAVFGHPLRSPRGRIVSHTFLFRFGAMDHLPQVSAADDAMDARWVHLQDLPALETQLFEDHGAILDHHVGLFPPA